MNTKNNRRRMATQEKLEQIFVELLQTKEINQITVAEICKQAQVNRSTFYDNYEDIYDLADKIRVKLEAEVSALFGHNRMILTHDDNLRLFTHMKNNQLIYNTYFKLGFDTGFEIDLESLTQENRYLDRNHIAYHLAFFRAGFNAVVKQWLNGGCQETAEEMTEIIRSEYRGRAGLTEKR